LVHTRALGPHDNQGVRDVLAALLLKREDIPALKELLAAYEEDGSALWAYTRALLAFRDGGASDDTARKRATEARAANEHVPGMLAGRTPAVLRLRDYITMGGSMRRRSTCARSVRRGAVRMVRSPGSAALPRRCRQSGDPARPCASPILSWPGERARERGSSRPLTTSPRPEAQDVGDRA
jgi:hypothetical protein